MHGDVGDPIAVEAKFDRHLVSAQRVDSLSGGVGIFQRMAVPGISVVIEDHIPVEVFQGHQLTPNRRPASPSASTRASMSLGVVYK